MESHDTQIIAANESTIKFYDFIDKFEKERTEKDKKAKEEKHKMMKELFQSLDTEKAMRLDKQNMLKYFNLLSSKMGTEEFKKAATVSPECYDDIWFEMDQGQTGFISWHAVKEFITKLIVHEAELEEERRIAAEIRAEKLEAKRKRKEEREAAKRAEEERLAKEAEENGSQAG